MMKKKLWTKPVLSSQYGSNIWHKVCNQLSQEGEIQTSSQWPAEAQDSSSMMWSNLQCTRQPLHQDRLGSASANPVGDHLLLVAMANPDSPPCPWCPQNLCPHGLLGCVAVYGVSEQVAQTWTFGHMPNLLPVMQHLQQEVRNTWLPSAKILGTCALLRFSCHSKKSPRL